MKNVKSLNLLVMIIGIATVGVGLYQLIIGDEFRHYFLSLFLGITLLGTGYMNHKEKI